MTCTFSHGPSPLLSMYADHKIRPVFFLTVTPHGSLVLLTTKYAMYSSSQPLQTAVCSCSPQNTPCILTHSHYTLLSIFPHNSVCPVYSWQLQNRFNYFCPLGRVCYPPSIQKQMHDINFVLQASANIYKTVDWYGEKTQCTVNSEKQTANDQPGDITFAKVLCWRSLQTLDPQLLYVKLGNPRGRFKTNTSSSHSSPATKSKNIPDMHFSILINL
jgi:hypothetical protein